MATSRRVTQRGTRPLSPRVTTEEVHLLDEAGDRTYRRINEDNEPPKGKRTRPPFRRL